MFTFGLILLGKAWTSLSPLAISKIDPQLFFYKNGFGIRYKFDMPLNKGTKPNPFKWQRFSNIHSTSESKVKENDVIHMWKVGEHTGKNQVIETRKVRMLIWIFHQKEICDM